MKSKIICCLLGALLPLSAMAQGTKADYERAYGLYDKFQQKNVSNWAHEVSWKNDTTLFSYYIDTPKGRSIR